MRAITQSVGSKIASARLTIREAARTHSHRSDDLSQAQKNRSSQIFTYPDAQQARRDGAEYSSTLARRVVARSIAVINVWAPSTQCHLGLAVVVASLHTKTRIKMLSTLDANMNVFLETKSDRFLHLAYLLSPDNGTKSILSAISSLRANSNASNQVAQLAGGWITRNDSDVRRGLSCDRNEIASLVDGKRTRVPSVGLGVFNYRQSTRRVNAVSRQRVLLRAIKLVVAIGSVEEVASNVDLGGLDGLPASCGLSGCKGRKRLGPVEGHASRTWVLDSPS